MELLTTNLIGPPRREMLHGEFYWVVPATSIVPGVLPGSKGPLLYTNEETGEDPGAWDGMPLTMYHPTKNGRHVSARQPEVLEKQGIGKIYNSEFDGRLRHEAWFNERLTEEADRRFGTHVMEDVRSGKPVELSTGLYTTNVPHHGTHNGREYVGLATDHRPDHLAVLPEGEVGACSLADGCGINVNAKRGTVEYNQQPSDDIDPDKACQILKDGEVRGHPLTEEQRGMFGAACKGATAKDGKTKNSATANAWSDEARSASVEARKSRGKSLDTAGHGKAAEAHEEAAGMHRQAAKEASKSGDWQSASDHLNTAASHVSLAARHRDWEKSGKTGRISQGPAKDATANWSDEARAAAAQARRKGDKAADASAKASGEGSHDHREAASIKGKDPVTAAKTHDAMAKVHDEKGHAEAAAAHREAAAAYRSVSKARVANAWSDEARQAAQDARAKSHQATEASFRSSRDARHQEIAKRYGNTASQSASAESKTLTGAKGASAAHEKAARMHDKMTALHAEHADQGGGHAEAVAAHMEAARAHREAAKLHTGTNNMAHNESAADKAAQAGMRHAGYASDAFEQDEDEDEYDDEEDDEGTPGPGSDVSEIGRIPNDVRQPPFAPSERHISNAEVMRNMTHHDASKSAMNASVRADHEGSLKHAANALTCSRGGDSKKAAKMHGNAAEAHEGRATELRSQGKHDDADLHDNAAAAHRRAASMHSANMSHNRRSTVTRKERLENARKKVAGLSRQQKIDLTTANCDCDQERAAVAGLPDAALTLHAAAAQAFFDVEDEPDVAAALKRKSEEEDDDDPNAVEPKVKEPKLSTNEWLKQAPPEVRSIVESAIEVHDEERGKLIARLTANARGALKDELQKMYSDIRQFDLRRLRMMVAGLPPTGPFTANVQEPEPAPSYLGNGSAQLDGPTANLDDSDMLMSVPFDWSEKAAN